ncbi:hypothetical protein PGIGA_G00208840 [Pangasianodon gigas]|uniref:Uncharacterized protein n=1 Tax=Pangasianodon gigas TaxID=30993 RepID=A0ACC5WFR1_PANGG|nr:hypothetical protein [Pangasianodon gigas]
MVSNKCNISVKNYFRSKNKKKGLQDPTNDFSIIPSWNKEFVYLIGLEEVVQFRLEWLDKTQDPTNDFSIIPSWNKEFVYLIGLEEVVQFRLEWLDKTVYTAPNKHRTRGRPKKFPIPAVVPAALPKDPFTCVKCNTDVSCSWKPDVNSSILCHACVKCSWRKDHWLSSGPTETIIKSISDNSSSLTSSNLSSPPGFYSDTSSQWSSSFSSEDYPCIYHSSSCPGSSLCDGSSPSYLPSYSDLNSSSSSMSPSPSGSPPKNSSKWVSQKGKTPYWMESPLTKALFIDDKAEQEMKKEKEEQLTRSKSQCKEEKTGKMAALSVPSSSSNQRILPKTQPALPDSVPSSSPLLSVSKHQFQTQILTSDLQKTSAEKNKLTMEEGLKPGHGNLQKITPNMSCGYISSKKSGSSTYTLDSEKSKSAIRYLPTTWSAVSGSVRQQDSRSIPRCFDDNKKESIMKNEKFGTKVQHQAAHAHPSSSRISSAPTHASFLSQTALSSNQGKTIPQNKAKWVAAPNQKIDKWIQKPESSMGSHGSYSSCSSASSSSSSSFDQPEKVNQQVLVSPKMKTFTTKFRSTPNGKPCDPKNAVKFSAIQGSNLLFKHSVTLHQDGIEQGVSSFIRKWAVWLQVFFPNNQEPYQVQNLQNVRCGLWVVWNENLQPHRRFCRFCTRGVS